MTIKIKQLVTKYSVITIGVGYNISANEKKIITKISYCRKGYNKGYQGDFPAYKINFEESPIRLIIPEKNIEHILIEKIEKIKKTIPELPDEDTIEEPYLDNTPEEELYQLREIETSELSPQAISASPKGVRIVKPTTKNITISEV